MTGRVAPTLADRHPSSPGSLAPRGSPEVAPVLESRELPLDVAYGVIHDTDADDFWISSPGGHDPFRGDGMVHRFASDWTISDDVIDVRAVGINPMDGVYDAATRRMWQVSGNNYVGCVYELDPVARVLTGRTICPGFGSPQDALARDAATDTFYSGSLDDALISHFDASGAFLDSGEVAAHVSGLAYNPATGHLFVLHQFVDVWAGPDVVIVDPAGGYATVGGFDVGAPGAWSAGLRGMDLDCDGYLWIVAQLPDAPPVVLKVDSGEASPCRHR